MKKHSIYLLLFFFFLSSCNSQEKSWKDAVNQNNTASYKDFLQKYPEGKYSQNAKDSIAELFCDSAKILKSIPLLKEFMSKYPDNNRISEIKEFIEELEWEKAFASRSEKMLKDCISNYPKSTNVEKANDTIWTINWPPIKLSKAESIVIYSKGLGIIRGCIIYQMSFMFGGGNSNPKPCDPVIYLWRDFSKNEMNYVQRIGLRTGVAYLKTGENQYRVIKKVDLNKSNDEICKIFGIKVN